MGSAAQLSTFGKSREAINNLNVTLFSSLINYLYIPKFPFFSKIVPPNSWQSVLAAAMLSGIAVVICMTPFDVVSTRLYNQSLDHRGKGLYYSGAADCFLKVFRTEGLLGLYKGCSANYMRVGPHTVLMLSFWTYLREVAIKEQ